MQDEDDGQCQAHDRTSGRAPPESLRLSKTLAHSPLRWPRCSDRACRRHRHCVMPASLCANRRLKLPRTEAQQDAALARIDRRMDDLCRRYEMEREAM